MNRIRTRQFSPHRRTRAALAALLATLAGSAANAWAATPAAAQYSVINLGPTSGARTLLNEQGQAALDGLFFNVHIFFDGDRLHDIGSLGGGYTSVYGINNRGTVVGLSTDASQPFGDSHAFIWTLPGGMRALPGANSAAWDVNDLDQVAGRIDTPDYSIKAVRWDANGRLVPLGPPSDPRSEAYVINNAGVVGGSTEAADGRFHATLWGGTSRLTDLGTVGGDITAISLLNERGEAAGVAYDAANSLHRSFFWSPSGGLATIRTDPSGYLPIVALNDRGEIAGLTYSGGNGTAYLWSRARGQELLPKNGAAGSDVSDINNRTQIVGVLRNPGSARAVRWDGVANPVDLNSRLYRPPAGLVLEIALAINDAGDILAQSNAGVVMLRPGTRGTDAPVLGPVRGLPETVNVGQEVALTLGFVDNAPGQTHTATVEWGDNCPSPHPLVQEAGGAGTVTLRHRFCAAGYYSPTIRVTDSGGRSTVAYQQVAVNAPGQAALSGQGTLARAPASAGRASPPLQFALWAPLANAPAGRAAGAESAAPFVVLDGPFRFRTDQLGAPVASARSFRLEGTGRLDGRPGYRLLAEVTHGGGQQAAGDRVRVRVTHKDARGAEVIDYDNAPAAGAGAPDGTVVVSGGVALSGGRWD